MKTFISSLLWAGVVVAAGVLPLRAEPPPANIGKVLVMEGDRTLEGDVERVGDQYRVRRAVGETWLPASRVQRLCTDYGDALDYLRGRANLNDPDERLRLGQWCLERGLQEQALAEVQAAVQMRPGNALGKHLLERLQQQSLNPTPATPAAHAEAEPESAAPIDLTVEALAQFTTKVQPILMNTCAACHANGRGGSFKLTRVNDGPTRNRKTVQQNLAAVIAQVNPGQPRNSRLLTKAVTLHGDMDKNPPMANRQAPAYRALEDWVRLTLANNPQLQDRVVSLPPAGPLPPEPKATTSGFAAEPRTGPIAVRADDATKPTVPSPPPAPATPLTNPNDKTPATEPADPYDPNEFNRQEHPQRVNPPAKKPA